MMVYRSKLEPADRDDFIFVVDAAYGPDFDRPVCSICWSQLDFEWGKAFAPGWTVPELQSRQVEDWVDKEGVSWAVCETTDRCINPDCDGANTYRYLVVLLSFSNPYHPEDKKKYRIKSKKFKDGKYDEHGIFLAQNKHGDWESIRVELGTRGVEVTYDDPWVFIEPGEFKSEIPSQWTIVDGKIKCNTNSKRFQKIRKWFADRQLRLEDI